MFIPGQIYRRRELHQKYGGQPQGGISTPRNHNLIFLFTGETGHQYGYRDRWIEDGIFLYSGEGQRGDMTFIRGNKAIRDHIKKGEDLHLFKDVGGGEVQYLGQMVCTGCKDRRGPDLAGQDRRIIVFELTPVAALSPGVTDLDEDPEFWQESLEELRKKAMAAAATTPKTPRERKASAYARSKDVRKYVLRRANGVCEACGQKAPFLTAADRPYLEPHHVRRLSDGGPDDLRWVIGVCPNCHARAHYGKDRAEFNRRLGEIVGEKEVS